MLLRQNNCAEDDLKMSTPIMKVRGEKLFIVYDVSERHLVKLKTDYHDITRKELIGGELTLTHTAKYELQKRTEQGYFNRERLQRFGESADGERNLSAHYIQVAAVTTYRGETLQHSLCACSTSRKIQYAEH